MQKSITDLNVSVPPVGWEKRFYRPLIPEQAEALQLMPRHSLTSEDVSDLIDGKEILEQYAKWKSKRDKKLFFS